MESAPKSRLKVAPMTFRSQQHTSMQHRLRGGQPYGRARRGKEMGADGVVEERGTQGVRPDRPPPRGRSGQAHLVPQSAIGATGAVHHARTAPRKEGSHLDTILRDARHGARVCPPRGSEWQSRCHPGCQAGDERVLGGPRRHTHCRQGRINRSDGWRASAHPRVVSFVARKQVQRRRRTLR